jgi:transcriptional regulator with PAS, ATPase and Fis domain
VALASEFSAVIPDTVLAQLSRPEMAVSTDKPHGNDARTAKSDDYSEQEFLAGYEKARYEVVRTARQLGISRQAVYRRINESPDLCLASELSDEQIRAALQSYGGDLTAIAMQLKVSRTALRERIRSVSPPGAG